MYTNMSSDEAKTQSEGLKMSKVLFIHWKFLSF